MSSLAQKALQGRRGDARNKDAYISSKEDKEAMLNRKMEEIRRKNEALKKRHEMIQADRLAAEKSGQAINLKQAATTEPLPPHKPQMRGVYADNEGQDGRKSKFTGGRGKRLANRSREELRAQNYEVKPRGETANNASSGRQSSGSTRSQEPKSPSEGGPPPDPGYSFLADRSREGPLPESRGRREHYSDRDHRGERGDRGGGGRRHPRNFGGGDFSNVKQRIQHEKYSQGRQRGGGVRSDMEMQLQMTGKERREYSEWKKEREKIDMSRLERQKTKEGDWRREWDKEKDEQAFDSTPAPPMSRHLEPARRPAGRIGSGRFDRGDDERSPGPGYEPEEDRSERCPPGRGYGPRGGRGDRGGRGGRGGRGEGRGERAGGRGGRGRRPKEKQRTMSSGSDDRSVEEQNDSLLIKVDNEFAMRGGRSGRGGRGGKRRGQGRDGLAVERSEEPRQREIPEKENKQQAARKEDQTAKSKEGEFRLGAPKGARSKKSVGSGRIGSGRLSSHDDEEVIIEDEDGNQTRRHLNSSGSAGEWETDTSSQSLTTDGELHNAEEDDYWEDDEEFYKFQSTELDEDLHNSSLESFDDSSFHRFIEKNTLRIDAKTGLPTRDKSGKHIPASAVPLTPTSPDPSDVSSPLHSLKTPTDHKKVLDWGAEMDALSPAGSKSGTSSSQSPNDSPEQKQDKSDNQDISISDRDDSLNASAETKRQLLFPKEGNEENPEKSDTKNVTEQNIRETATEPEEVQVQNNEKDKMSEARPKSSDNEEQETTAPAENAEVEEDVQDLGKASDKKDECRKDDMEEEDEEFEDATEDEEADEFVDAGSNVVTPQAGSREVSAEPSPQTSPQHKAIPQSQEAASQNDDAITEETEDSSHKDDVAKGTENVTQGNDIVKESTDNVKSKTDGTETKSDDVRETIDDVTKEDVTSKGDVAKPDVVKETADDVTIETTSKEDETESSQKEEAKSDEKASSDQPQSDSVDESYGANVNIEISPTEDAGETASPPPEGAAEDKSSPEEAEDEAKQSQENETKDGQTDDIKPDASTAEEDSNEKEPVNKTSQPAQTSTESEDKPTEDSLKTNEEKS